MSTTLEFCVDWDAENWLDTPDFTGTYDDISAYVKSYQLSRGIKTEQGNAPAGTLNIVLNNASGMFSPTNGASDITGLIRPWLPVRFRATVGVTTYTVYTGFISRISCDPHPSRQAATLYCTDGMDLLARNMVTQDDSTRSETSDGDAVGYVLDAAGWPAAKRSIDVSGGNITKYPLTVEY